MILFAGVQVGRLPASEPGQYGCTLYGSCTF